MLAEVVLPLGASWGLGWAGAPPAPTTPRGVPWAGHGTARESHPKAAGCWSRASPTPASPGHRGGAAGGSPRAGSASRRFPRAGKSPKKLKSSNFHSQDWLSLGAGKGGAQAGTGMSPEHPWHPPESPSSDCTKVPPPLPNLSLFQLS